MGSEWGVRRRESAVSGFQVPNYVFPSWEGLGWVLRQNTRSPAIACARMVPSLNEALKFDVKIGSRSIKSDNISGTYQSKKTSNLKPQTSNLKPQTSNLKPQTSNIKHQTYRPFAFLASLRLNFFETAKYAKDAKETQRSLKP